MKGYTKNLREFIEYVLENYSKDENVQKFQTVYTAKQNEALERKNAKRERPSAQNYVKISQESAIICKKLVEMEIYKDTQLHSNNRDFTLKLHNARKELSGECIDGVKRLLEVMRRNG